MSCISSGGEGLRIIHQPRRYVLFCVCACACVWTKAHRGWFQISMKDLQDASIPTLAPPCASFCGKSILVQNPTLQFRFPIRVHNSWRGKKSPLKESHRRGKKERHTCEWNNRHNEAGLSSVAVVHFPLWPAPPENKQRLKKKKKSSRKGTPNNKKQLESLRDRSPIDGSFCRASFNKKKIKRPFQNGKRVAAGRNWLCNLCKQNGGTHD